MDVFDERFHEQWMGMAQPSFGLVVSAPVLVDAKLPARPFRELHRAFLNGLTAGEDGRRELVDLERFFAEVLELEPSRFDAGDALPRDLALHVPFGRQTLRPTRALRGPSGSDAYDMLVWEVPRTVENLDKPEAVTGPWSYPAQAKFERLLRTCRVPIGVLSNGREIRLVYAPHGESTGYVAFRVPDMAEPTGRPLFQALVLLLSSDRWVTPEAPSSLPFLLAESRRRNADVTKELSRQLEGALELLLSGFSTNGDPTPVSDSEGPPSAEELHRGLVTLLLRLVFLIYCEERDLVPTDHPLYANNYSVLGLFNSLEADLGTYPEAMHRRFSAYPRILAACRLVFRGARHRDLVLPARRGELFDPNAHPLLEGRSLPSDHTIHAVLEKLLFLDGKRLSYKALDVEQIGSVYEGLMGLCVHRLEGPSVRLRLGKGTGGSRAWVDCSALLAIPPGERQSFFADQLGFDRGLASEMAKQTATASSVLTMRSALEAFAAKVPEHAAKGALVVQPGPERRRTSSHYTPRSLTEPIVARTLGPLLSHLGDRPSSERILDLVVCDPAVGSGAFLVAACRFLAETVVSAWTREGRTDLLGNTEEDALLRARRIVAQRCLYGVDKNPNAVRLARLSLWLFTMARSRAFTFVDHAVRPGDALVGLGPSQLRAFHWAPAPEVHPIARLVDRGLETVRSIRHRLRGSGGSEGEALNPTDHEQDLVAAAEATKNVRLIGDLIVGAFFAKSTFRERELERRRRLELVSEWLGAEERGDSSSTLRLATSLREMQAELLGSLRPFHWVAEFPEVFAPEGGVHAFVGNPPFLGGKRISTEHGACYAEWLETVHHATKNTDLAAHFFLRSETLLRDPGVIGLIGTNTLAQGDTRRGGLGRLLEKGLTIYDATRSMPWPGDASVSVSVVHLVKGDLGPWPKRLDGQEVTTISSRLRPAVELPDAVPLVENRGLCFIGCFLRGEGFVLSPNERDALLHREPSSSSLVRPFLGGEEVNTSSTQTFHRYVVDLGESSLEELAAHPETLRLLSERVKPQREKLRGGRTDAIHRAKWWLFANSRPELRRHLSGLSRCLVCARVTKHLCFAFQPTDRTFSDQLCVFPRGDYASFAVLQSRVHEAWARLLSSTLGEGLRYAPSDCLETFPFPSPGAKNLDPALGSIGEALYEARSAFMRDEDKGLTKTYNLLRDPSCRDARILDLRALHEELDRVVIGAYGFGELVVPPYASATEDETLGHRVFEDEVIDRLLELNSRRASGQGKES